MAAVTRHLCKVLGGAQQTPAQPSEHATGEATGGECAGPRRGPRLRRSQEEEAEGERW